MMGSRIGGLALAFGLSFGGLFAGCIHETPSALKEAEGTYNRVAQGPARETARSYLMTAKKALDRAQESFDNYGDSKDTRDLAYIAERLAMVADAQAQLGSAVAERDDQRRNLQVAQSRFQSGQGQAGVEQKIEAEREARLEAERRAEEAQTSAEHARSQAQAEQKAAMSNDQTLRALQELGEVREDARGTVLNLAGSVLFTSGRSDLNATGRDRLAGLADALKRMGGSHVTIEGYTDSTGSKELNQRLSEARAQSVKRVLVENGVEANRIDTVGRGEDNPVADNSTPEGRASNRRVEVVLERPTS